VKLDLRSGTPVILGKAVKLMLSSRPEWRGKVGVEVYGNTYPDPVVQRALENDGVADVVKVRSPVPHGEAIRLAQCADLLFLVLPKRQDGSPGSRIAAKTYEYLMTDRPILAAISAGENRRYLRDKQGVFIVEQDDVVGMASVIDRLAERHFSGKPLRVDRSDLISDLSYDTRAAEFRNVIERACGRNRASPPSLN